MRLASKQPSAAAYIVLGILRADVSCWAALHCSNPSLDPSYLILYARRRRKSELESSFDVLNHQRRSAFNLSFGWFGLVCIQSPCKFGSRPQHDQSWGMNCFAAIRLPAFIVLAENNACYQMSSIIPSVGRR